MGKTTLLLPRQDGRWWATSGYFCPGKTSWQNEVGFAQPHLINHSDDQRHQRWSSASRTGRTFPFHRLHQSSFTLAYLRNYLDRCATLNPLYIVGTFFWTKTPDFSNSQVENLPRSTRLRSIHSNRTVQQENMILQRTAVLNTT